MNPRGGIDSTRLPARDAQFDEPALLAGVTRSRTPLSCERRWLTAQCSAEVGTAFIRRCIDDTAVNAVCAKRSLTNAGATEAAVVNGLAAHQKVDSDHR
jgi:hypothetical protein